MAEEENNEEKPIKKAKTYEVVEVPTQMGLAFKTPEEEVLSTEQLLVEIANRVRNIEKGIVG